MIPFFAYDPLMSSTFMEKEYLPAVLGLEVGSEKDDSPVRPTLATMGVKCIAGARLDNYRWTIVGPRLDGKRANEEYDDDENEKEMPPPTRRTRNSLRAMPKRKAKAPFVRPKTTHSGNGPPNAHGKATLLREEGAYTFGTLYAVRRYTLSKILNYESITTGYVPANMRIDLCEGVHGFPCNNDIPARPNEVKRRVNSDIYNPLHVVPADTLRSFGFVESVVVLLVDNPGATYHMPLRTDPSAHIPRAESSRNIVKTPDAAIASRTLLTPPVTDGSQTSYLASTGKDEDEIRDPEMEVMKKRWREEDIRRWEESGMVAPRPLKDRFWLPGDKGPEPAQNERGGPLVNRLTGETIIAPSVRIRAVYKEAMNRAIADIAFESKMPLWYLHRYIRPWIPRGRFD